MANNYYFPHEYNARNDEKILLLRSKYGYEGYGIYWALVELLQESTNGYLKLDNIHAFAISLNVGHEWLKEFINYCINTCNLFEKNKKNNFTAKRIIKHKEYRKKQSINGSIGASRRWSSSGAMATPSQLHSDPNANKIKEKEKKEKEIYISNSFEEIWKKYPNKDGKKDAYKYYKLSVKNQEDVEKCEKALTNYLRSDKVKNGFIKNGSTWFNNWQDWIEFKQVKVGRRY